MLPARRPHRTPARAPGRSHATPEPAMKLHVLSDLHLTVNAFDAPSTDADVVVLAGDVARPDQAIAWASELAKPVVYVPGNHEYYDGSISGTVGRLKQLCAD